MPGGLYYQSSSYSQWPVRISPFSQPVSFSNFTDAKLKGIGHFQIRRQLSQLLTQLSFGAGLVAMKVAGDGHLLIGFSQTDSPAGSLYQKTRNTFGCRWGNLDVDYSPLPGGGYGQTHRP